MRRASHRPRHAAARERRPAQLRQRSPHPARDVPVVERPDAGGAGSGDAPAVVLLHYGLRVTINTDNRLMTDTTVSKELLLATSTTASARRHQGDHHQRLQERVHAVPREGGPPEEGHARSWRRFASRPSRQTRRSRRSPSPPPPSRSASASRIDGLAHDQLDALSAGGCEGIGQVIKLGKRPGWLPVAPGGFGPPPGPPGRKCWPATATRRVQRPPALEALVGDLAKRVVDPRKTHVHLPVACEVRLARLRSLRCRLRYRCRLSRCERPCRRRSLASRELTSSLASKGWVRSLQTASPSLARWRDRNTLTRIERTSGSPLTS